MRLCLLQCDHVDDEFQPIAGNYDAMFRNLFADFPDVTLEVFDVTRREFPDTSKAPGTFDGYLTTGSRRSVTDELDWINELEVLVRSLYVTGNKFVGICFGHQMIAHALGGRVSKAEGWSIGVHTFERHRHAQWMDPPLDRFSLLMSCQDQIEHLPPEGRVLASSPSCPVGVFELGEHFLGIQGHPEFHPNYAGALMEARRGNSIDASTVDSARRSLVEAHHGSELGSWIHRFFS